MCSSYHCVANCGRSASGPFLARGSCMWESHSRSVEAVLLLSCCSQTLDHPAVMVSPSLHFFSVESRCGCSFSQPHQTTFEAMFTMNKFDPSGPCHTPLEQAVAEFVSAPLCWSRVRRRTSPGQRLHWLGTVHTQKMQAHSVGACGSSRWGKAHVPVFRRCSVPGVLRLSSCNLDAAGTRGTQASHLVGIRVCHLLCLFVSTMAHDFGRGVRLSAMAEAEARTQGTFYNPVDPRLGVQVALMSSVLSFSTSSHMFFSKCPVSDAPPLLSRCVLFCGVMFLLRAVLEALVCTASTETGKHVCVVL